MEKGRVARMIKKLIYTIFIVALLCGCTVNGGKDSESATGLLTLEIGCEWRAEKMTLPDFEGTIAAAALYDDKLWFVSGQTLYTANLDGSDTREIFGGVPDCARYIASDANGDVYFCGTGEVYIFDKDGAQKSQFALEIDLNTPIRTIFGAVTSPGGEPVALIWDDREGYSVRAVTSEGLGDELDFDLPTGTDIRGMSFYDERMLLTQGEGLFIRSDSDPALILTWADIGVVFGEAYILGVVEDAEIIYLNRYDGTLYEVRQKPEERTELTLACVTDNGRLQPDMERAVAVFNTYSKEYRVVIEKYESLELLNLQIIAGNVPDFINIDYIIPFKNFAAKGLFEDLNPYFENDPEVALVPVIHRIMSDGDELFRISPGFMVMSLIGIPDYVGEEQGWTFEEMKQYLADVPEGATVLPITWHEEAALTFLLYQNINEFIDWESGTAFFDTPDFKELLEFTNTMSSDTSQSIEQISLLLEGKQLIVHTTQQILEHFVYTDFELEGKAVYKGFPGKSKNSGILYPHTYTLAMTSVCENKDGAWSFIRSSLLLESSEYFIPTVQSKFDLAVEKAMTEQYMLYPQIPGQGPPPTCSPDDAGAV